MSLSNFPIEIDTFKQFVDITTADVFTMMRYKTLREKTSLTPTEQSELISLVTQLSNKLITASDINKITDSIVALQRFTKDNVDQYFKDAQESALLEFDAMLSKFTYRGEYNPTTQYYRMNMVKSSGHLYFCIQDALNKAPTNTDYWIKIAEKGDKGDPGLGLRFTGLFDINRAYNENDAVAYNSEEGYAIYYCLTPCIGVAPTNTDYWAVFMSVAQMSSIIGNMDELETENKSSIVNAINEVVTLALSKANEEHNHVVEDITNFPELANVALSGDYEDLNNTPTIPTVINNLTSEDTTEALSAAQGKILKDEITSHKAENATLNQLGHVNHAVLTATLDTSWSGSSAPYTKTISVSGILSTDVPFIDIVMSGTYATDTARQEAWGYIYRAVTGADSITFYATDKPTVDLPIQIKVVR